MEQNTNQANQTNVTPTLEQLEKERSEVLAKLSEIQKTQQDNAQSKVETNELETLRKENEQLKSLVENYKTDVLNASKFAQQVMLEYGQHKQQSNVTEQQTAQHDELSEARKALDDYIKSKLTEEN